MVTFGECGIRESLGVDGLWLERSFNTSALLSSSESGRDDLERARLEFLAYIYEQIDNLLSRCISQANSRSNTPLSAARNSTPPALGDRSSQFDPSSRCDVPTRAVKPAQDNPVAGRVSKAPRRVQLFTSGDKPDLVGKCITIMALFHLIVLNTYNYTKS